MELLEEITSYVDEELKDQNICCRMKKLITDDYVIRNEYMIQKCIKDLLRTRFSCCKSPVGLDKKIFLYISQNINN
ncbi:MAG: hypothetical protein FIA82_12095 [Melioribacter sp.]|nr:hypothetical protein [Melioribacter sp.]